MANLKLSYLEVYTKVGEFIGIPSLTDAADITKAKDIVKRGYRKFLMPNDISTRTSLNPVGDTYRWKFLEKTTTLSVVADTDTYKLPLGFSSFVTPFTHTTPLSWNPTQRSLSFIYEQKSQTTGTGYPRYFALKDGDYDVITGQQYEVMFEPMPSASLTYYYTYIYTPPAPVEDDDVFVGDDLTSEAILECALAVAELQVKDKIGIHNQEAERLTQMLIGKDKSDALVPYLGQMTDGKISEIVRSATIYNQSGTQILPE